MSTFDPQQQQLELQAIIWGHVQGIGFRVTARHLALQLGLTGIVRNLEDGNVEVIAQGSRQKLDEFIKLIKEHFGPGYIARIDIKFEKPKQSFEHFKVIPN